MQEELAPDTGRREQRPDDEQYEYDVYLSYASSDQVIAMAISRSLAALGIRVFDESELIPGEVTHLERQRAMTNSRRLAVLFGAGDAAPLEQEEADQAALSAGRDRRPAFAIYLPGYDN